MANAQCSVLNDPAPPGEVECEVDERVNDWAHPAITPHFVARAASPAGSLGVSPGAGRGLGAETPPTLAGEDACATGVLPGYASAQVCGSLLIYIITNAY